MPRRNTGPSQIRRATLRDVAQAAGVSVWTVSNTFSNPDRVAEATRQRVLEAADALDFAGPNPGARSLALGRTQTICLTTGDGEARLLLADPAAALVAEGLLTACDRAGFSLLLSGRPDGQIADGVVYFRGVAPGEQAPRGPVVVVDGDALEGVPRVTADVRGAAAAMAAHLFDLGHRRIAVLGHPEAGERLLGVADGWNGPQPIPVYGVGPSPRRGWPDRADGEAAARTALAVDPRTTALLALTDVLAHGALDAVHRLGLRAPHDVSVAGIDDLPGSDAVGLTTALVPYRSLGVLAGDLLIGRLAGAPLPDAPELPTALSLRRSTGPPHPRGV